MKCWQGRQPGLWPLETQPARLPQGARDLGAACPGLGLMGAAGEDTGLAVGRSAPVGRTGRDGFWSRSGSCLVTPGADPSGESPSQGAASGGCPRPGTVHAGAQSGLLGVRSWDGPSQLTCQVRVSPHFQVGG